MRCEASCGAGSVNRGHERPAFPLSRRQQTGSRRFKVSHMCNLSVSPSRRLGLLTAADEARETDFVSPRVPPEPTSTNAADLPLHHSKFCFHDECWVNVHPFDWGRCSRVCASACVATHAASIRASAAVRPRKRTYSHAAATRPCSRQRLDDRHHLTQASGRSAPAQPAAMLLSAT